MSIRKLFATRIYEANLGDEELLSELAVSIRHLATQDAEGRLWSQQFGYRGYCSCATANALHLKDGPFRRLAVWLSGEAAAFAQECAFELPRELQLERMWANILENDGHHRSHVHARSIITGTIFVEAAPDSGATCFEDPRLPLMMASPPRKNGAPEDLHSVVTVEPHRGLLLLWESWLRHEVLTGRGTQDRLSVTFDFT